MKKLIIIAMISLFLIFISSIIHAQGFPTLWRFPNFSYQYGQSLGFQTYTPGYFSSFNPIGQYGQQWFPPTNNRYFRYANSGLYPPSMQIMGSFITNNGWYPPTNNRFGTYNNGWYVPPNNGYATYANNGWNTYYANIVAAGRVGLKIITEEDNGTTITLEKGDRIEIVLPVIYDGEWDEKGERLNDTPSSWDSGVIKENYTPVDMNPDVMQLIPSNYGNSLLQLNYYREQKEIPVKTYEAVGEGEFELVLEYFRPSNPYIILDTFSIIIKVED